jgi:hypothetical protein
MEHQASITPKQLRAVHTQAQLRVLGMVRRFLLIPQTQHAIASSITLSLK